jgi:hypothetical protein
VTAHAKKSQKLKTDGRSHDGDAAAMAASDVKARADHGSSPADPARRETPQSKKPKQGRKEQSKQHLPPGQLDVKAPPGRSKDKGDGNGNGK